MDYLSGMVFDGYEFSEGYVGLENGMITEIGDGRPPAHPVCEGIVVPGLVNAHTHSADGLITFTGTPGLEELVAPPNGLKHVYLKNASDDELIMSMRSFTDMMFRNGTTGFVDFREGGRKGVELMRISSPVPNGMILGRPSGSYDSNELNAVLDVSDGIGLSSISDIASRDLDAIADHVRKRGKVLGIHTSERIREDIEKVMSLSPSFVVHMTEATDADMRACADNGVPIVSCPRSNMFFGKVPPAGRLIDSGADIALGTDNAMLCDPDIRAEAKVFAEILGSEYNGMNTLRTLLVNCRKVLYGREKLKMRAGSPADIAVFPSSGRDVLTDITCLTEDASMTVLNGRMRRWCHSSGY